MRKPIDPRKHGLKKPQASIREYKTLGLGKHPSLEETIHRWIEIENSHKCTGNRVVEGPVLEEMPRNHQNLMANCNRRFLAADTPFELPESRAEM